MNGEEIEGIWRRFDEMGEPPEELVPLAGDGSDRHFFRCRWHRRRDDPAALLLVLPAQPDERGLAEATAAAAIGRHLGQAGVPVPRIYGFDPVSGAVLMEDLGDLLLHKRLMAGPAAAEIKELYRQAIEALLTLQVVARPGFPVEYCWDSRHYDHRLMLERESGYFYQALGREWLNWGAMPDELAAEFVLLADLAAEQPADFVLHRDYQSRNLMLNGKRLRIIDFQGARLGPLAYDLASLLNDPYVALAPALRTELFEFYLKRAAALLPGFDRQGFRRGWYFLALQRNLQILGAFAFLTRRRGKTFFRDYLVPAAGQLAVLLAGMPEGHQFPRLRSLAATLPDQIKSGIKS